MYESEVPLRKDLELKPDELAELFDPIKINRKESSIILSKYGTKGLLQKLNVELSQGLNDENNEGEEIKQRQIIFGKNSFESQLSEKSLFYFLKYHLNQLHIKLLIVFSIFMFSFSFLTFFMEQLINQSVMMFLTVIIVVTSASVIDARRTEEFEKTVRNQKKLKARVLRNGRNRIVIRKSYL